MQELVPIVCSVFSTVKFLWNWVKFWKWGGYDFALHMIHLENFFLLAIAIIAIAFHFYYKLTTVNARTPTQEHFDKLEAKMLENAVQVKKLKALLRLKKKLKYEKLEEDKKENSF